MREKVTGKNVGVQFVRVKCERVNKLAKNMRVKNGKTTNVKVKTGRIKFVSIENATVKNVRFTNVSVKKYEGKKI